MQENLSLTRLDMAHKELHRIDQLQPRIQREGAYVSGTPAKFELKNVGASVFLTKISSDQLRLTEPVEKQAFDCGESITIKFTCENKQGSNQLCIEYVDGDNEERWVRVSFNQQYEIDDVVQYSYRQVSSREMVLIKSLEKAIDDIATQGIT